MEKQLILNDNGQITEEQRAFIKCHNDIVFSARSAYDFAYKMAVEIKRMRDDKLYSAGGFDSFGDYCEKALGMKERNAYNYIQVVEKYSEVYLQSNAKLGVTKLLLLSSLSDADRAKLEEDAESNTVKELKDKIEKIKSSQGEQLSLLEKKHEEDTRRIQNELQKVTVEKEKLEKRYNALKAAPPVVKTVEKPEEEHKTNELERRIKDAEARELTLIKQLEIAKDSNVTKFSVKFEDLQKIIGEIEVLLGAMTADNRERCKKALASVLGGIAK